MMDDPACQPPQPALPGTGEQPADVDTARADVIAAVKAVIAGTPGWRDAVADTTDVGRFSDDASTTDTADPYLDGLVAEISEVVFTSPTRAWVRVDPSDFDLGQDNFAVVELTGDAWKLTHGG